MRQTRHPDHEFDAAIPAFKKINKKVTYIWYMYVMLKCLNV